MNFARPTIEAAARQRGLHNVLFRPYQPREQLSQALSVADVHLVSLNPELEGLIVPSKFYGIAAAGRPTLFVGDTNGEIALQLRQHNCGFSVATGDSAALAKRIAQLADDPALCVALGAHARNLLQTRYDRPLAVAHWKKVLL